MTIWIEGFLVLLVLTSLWMLGSSRLLSCVAAIAAQGLLLGALPLVIRIDAPAWRLAVQAVMNVGLKGIVFPLLLLRAIRSLDVKREVEPSVGYTASLVVGIALLAASLLLGSRLPIPGALRPLLLVPASFFTAFTGLFVIIGRKSAVMQVLGYLAMENGIAVFAVALAEQEPLLVEMGTFLDAFVAVFVMGIAIFHINREFDHIDSGRLSSLRD